jgi:hypothetical protein
MKIRPVAAEMAMRTDMKLSLFALLWTRLKDINHAPFIIRFHLSLVATSSIPNTCLPVRTNLQHRQFLMCEAGQGGRGDGNKEKQTNEMLEHLTENWRRVKHSVLPIIQFPYRNSHHTGTTRAFRQKPTLQYKMRVYTQTRARVHLHLLNVKSVTTKILSYSNTNIFTLPVVKPILTS